ncbi:MAG: serine hydrolase domain-containing protein [Bacteroidota bacterium]
MAVNMTRVFIYFPKNILATLLVLVSVQMNAQQKTLDDSLRQIDKLFENVNTTTPGNVISITRHGQPIYQKAFGMADLEHNVVNTTETIFEAGSVSKQFTAASILLLVKAGKIALKDDIRKFFPDFPDYGNVITVEHLLHHTSGLRDWGSVAGIGGWPRGTRKYTTAHVKEIIWRQKQINFIPGSEYSYSNSNFNMLMLLVEKVSGETFQQFTQEHIFTPMGMTHTRWRDNYNTVVPGRAIAYGKEGNAYEQNMPFENTFGHGALLTTVGDLEKWNQRWKNNKLGADINLLQKTKGVLNNGVTISYACGVVVNTVNGFEEISHTGATAGYRALLAYYPEKEISVAFLSNDANASVGRVSSTIEELFLGKETNNKPPEKYTGVAVSAQSLAGKTGLYKHMRVGDVQELGIVNDSLAFKPSGVTLIPIAETKFAKDGFVIQFPAAIANPKTMLFQNPSGDTATYFRVNAFTGGENAMKELTGTYQSDEADAVMNVVVKDGNLQLLLHPDTYIKLDPVYADAFSDGETFCQFLRNNKKKVTGFTITVSRVRNLLFTKIK